MGNRPREFFEQAMTRKSILLASVLTVCAFGAAHAADNPTLLGSSRDWSAYTYGSGSAKTCYALSKPKSVEPAKAKRDPIYFLISNWPGRRVKGEPEVVPGYQYKAGSTVTAEIGADKFTFFTQNEGGAGGAWVQNPADEQRLINAMRAGSQMIVTGISQRGTMTRDTYSLAGISAALDQVAQACR